ncbi:hypothetical protein SDC9_149303 [bioreactor metagenome]|uniref:Uncharacterized protein n=1 Tax=bioreactor metagenome TaxID=1076179 RepID=A0A645EL86_9ZZZZ
MVCNQKNIAVFKCVFFKVMINSTHNLSGNSFAPVIFIDHDVADHISDATVSDDSAETDQCISIVNRCRKERVFKCCFASHQIFMSHAGTKTKADIIF